MTLSGIVHNGAIVLENGATLPDGLSVEVIVRESAAPTNSTEPTLAGLLKFAGCLSDLPSDFAAEHDHYIHGTPKRNEKAD